MAECKVCKEKVDGRLRCFRLSGVCQTCHDDLVEPLELNLIVPEEIRMAETNEIIWAETVYPVAGLMSEEAVTEEECKKEKAEKYPVAGLDLSGKAPKKRFWEFWK